MLVLFSSPVFAGNTSTLSKWQYSRTKLRVQNKDNWYVRVLYYLAVIISQSQSNTVFYIIYSNICSTRTVVALLLRPRVLPDGQPAQRSEAAAPARDDIAAQKAARAAYDSHVRGDDVPKLATEVSEATTQGTCTFILKYILNTTDRYWSIWWKQSASLGKCKHLALAADTEGGEGTPGSPDGRVGDSRKKYRQQNIASQ